MVQNDFRCPVLVPEKKYYFMGHNGIFNFSLVIPTQKDNQWHHIFSFVT